MQPDSPPARGELPVVERVRVSREFAELAGLAVLHVVAGEVQVRYGDGELSRVDTGDLLVVGSDACCRLGGRRAEARGVLFRATPAWTAGAGALARAEALPSGHVSLVRGGTEASRHAGRLLHALLNDEASPLRRAARCLDLVDFALASRDAAPISPRRPGGGKRAALYEALEKLESEPLDGLSLREFAARVGVSERQVSRLLRRELGMSFGQVLTDLRTARAVELLAGTDHPVVEVAGRAGFGSLSHFNSVFRSRTGLTPSGFRERSREGDSPRDG